MSTDRRRPARSASGAATSHRVPGAHFSCSSNRSLPGQLRCGPRLGDPLRGGIRRLLRRWTATATEWVTRLTDAHHAGRLPAELTRLRRYGLIIVDEVGYLPFEQDAANLFFQLVSSRYEHASLVLTSQPAVQRLGRRLRRPSRRRSHDRPHRPPRRRPHPQRRQLPATQPRDRHPAQHQNPERGRLETRTGGLVFERRIGLRFERCRQLFGEMLRQAQARPMI